VKTIPGNEVRDFFFTSKLQAKDLGIVLLFHLEVDMEFVYG